MEGGRENRSIEKGRKGHALTWPKPTSTGFSSVCNSEGSHDWRLSLSLPLLVRSPRKKKENMNVNLLNKATIVAYLVSSGVDVGGLCHPILFVIRWTCTSTPMPWFKFHAVCNAHWDK
jgi:hypothetical protein